MMMPVAAVPVVGGIAATYKFLGSVAIVSGLVYKYRKPLMDMERKLITNA